MYDFKKKYILALFCFAMGLNLFLVQAH